jgi:hypothetical protein
MHVLEALAAAVENLAAIMHVVEAVHPAGPPDEGHAAAG